MDIKEIKYGQIIERYYVSSGWMRVKVTGRVLDEINRLGENANIKFRLIKKR